MTEYVEKFIINRKTYGIEALPDDKFYVWSGGCGIYKADTIADARAMLHTYACNQSRAEVGSYQTVVDNATNALERLGTDPFNLGRFRA